ncbi:hypothetical protein HQ544_02045 [Candidatus Falkowbacteria bacterium]|nr:hypothetical protein [Candidatus Falkowbacteria bacterium]
MKKDNKTIGITVRFFTNGLPDKIGKRNMQTPFWSNGNVHLEANISKNIRAQNELFHYIDDIPRAIREVMCKAKLAAVEDVAYTSRAVKRGKK